MCNYKSFRRVLALTLALSIGVGPVLPQALAVDIPAPASVAPNQGAPGAANTGLLGSLSSLIGGGAQPNSSSLQGLIAGFQAGQQAYAQNSTTTAGRVTNAINLAKTELQTCMGQGGTSTISSSSLQLIDAPATCDNAEDIIKAAKKNDKALQAFRTKSKCLAQFQGKIEAAMKLAQSDFQKLYSSASDMVGKYKQLEDKYTEIAKTIDTKLLGPEGDGKGGLLEQLELLKGIKGGIRSALNNPSHAEVQLGSGKTGIKLMGGLPAELKRINQKKVALGNKWAQTLSGQVWRCMNDFPQTCHSDSGQVPAIECLRSIVRTDSAGHTADRNLHTFDIVLQRLNNRFSSMANGMKGDIKNPDAFLTAMMNKMDSAAEHLSGELEGDNAGWIGGFDPSTLVSEFKNRMNTCKETAGKEFANDFNNGVSRDPKENAQQVQMGDMYANPSAQLVSDEQVVFNESMQWVDLATENMNKFRTSFYGSYDNTLAQWADNCRKPNDAAGAVTCVTKLERILQDGIDGTNTEPYQSIPLPTVSVDAKTGAVTSASQSFQCKGFNQCVDVMQQYASHNRTQADTKKTERQAFIASYNQTFQTSLDSVKAVAEQANAALAMARAKINDELGNAGVAASLMPKAATDGEDAPALETETEEPKTGMNKAPSNMAKLLGLQSLDPENLQDVDKAINERSKKVAEARRDAESMKLKCTVDLAGLRQAARGSCDPEELLSNANRVFLRAQTMPDTEATSFDNMLESCVNKINSDAEAALSASTTANANAVAATPQGAPPPARISTRIVPGAGDATNYCLKTKVLSSVTALAGSARGELSDKMNSIAGGLRAAIKDHGDGCVKLKAALDDGTSSEESGDDSDSSAAPSTAGATTADH